MKYQKENVPDINWHTILIFGRGNPTLPPLLFNWGGHPPPQPLSYAALIALVRLLLGW